MATSLLVLPWIARLVTVLAAISFDLAADWSVLDHDRHLSKPAELDQSEA